MSGTTTFEIRQIADTAGRRDWLAVPYLVYAGDPSWIPPLDLQEKERISPSHNPLFAFGEAAFFVAYREARPVGRISAQVNRRHLEHHHDGVGFFGFFDCVDDQAIADGLLQTAAKWLKERGLSRMRGPFNLTVNQDSGLLVDGFDTSPSILTSHAAPWTGKLVEAAGLPGVADLYAYRMHPERVPPEITRLAALARQSARIKTRPMAMSRFRDEVALIFDIFNDAWSDNWGFVPVGKAEIDAMARDTRPIMRGKFGRIVEIDGEPAAMMVVLPDLNQVVAPFRGKLLPFNWAKLVAAVLRDRWTTARVPLLGIRKAHRGDIIAPAVLSLLITDLMELGRGYDIEWIEFSWVLSSNRAMVRLAELAAGKPVKTYRVYEKAI
ncbi:MAG: hypothetical protein R3D44_11135 [Hyphomicrobiaceae bacterium]